MIGADVIEDGVEQNFHFLLVSCSNELLVIVYGAEVWIDRV